MGWVNTFSVPITYFIMKYNDMFLSPGIDYDGIVKKAEENAKSMGIQNGNDIDLTGEGAEGISKTRSARAQLSRVSENVQDGLAGLTSWGSSFMLYNMLPGFASIRSGVYQYLDNIYSKYVKKDLERKGASRAFRMAKKGLLNMAKRVARFVPFTSVILGAIEKMIPDISKYFAWQTIILVLSFVIALGVWKLSFITIFLSSIAMMILLKTVLYFKELLIHTIISPFLVLWAFSGGQQGNSKMLDFMKDTLVLMVYPILIVLSSYTFIFVYELFSVLYTFLMTTMIEGQKATISLLSVANSDVSSFSAYYSMSMLGYMSSLMVDVFGLILAVIILLKLPELILKKMGLGDSNSMGITQNAEAIHSRGEKHANGNTF